MKDKTLEEGARAFARTLQVPGGRTSFDFAVRTHGVWFGTALARGLSWNQIIELLRQAGVCRDDGRPLSRGHLSKVYSRQKAATPAVRANSPTAQSEQKAGPHRHARVSAPAPLAQHPPPPLGNASKALPTNSNKHAQIKSFMARAAQQRKYNAES